MAEGNTSLRATSRVTRSSGLSPSKPLTMILAEVTKLSELVIDSMTCSIHSFSLMHGAKGSKMPSH